MHAEMSDEGLQDSPDTDTAMQARLETQQQSTSGIVHRLPMDHELFGEGNLRRGLLAQQAAVSQEDKNTAQSTDSSPRPEDDACVWECRTCGHLLLTARQLDLHVQEVHDSFFQAQAARSMKVFRCMVEGCEKKFSTPLERKQHLADFHRYPRGYLYDALHLGRRRPSHPSRPPHAPRGGDRGWQGAIAHLHHQQSRGQASEATQEGNQGQEEEDTKGKPGEGTSSEMDVDSLAQGMSSLSSCLSESSEVPSVVGFGRRNRRKAFS